MLIFIVSKVLEVFKALKKSFEKKLKTLVKIKKNITFATAFKERQYSAKQ